MKKLLILMTALTLTALVPAAEQGGTGERFWLNYVKSRAAQRLPGVPGVYSSTNKDKPEDVKLPQLENVDWSFRTWKPDLVDTEVLVAVAGTGSGFTLYVDSDQDRDLTDEVAHESWLNEYSSWYFGPAQVILETANGPVTYHLNMRLSAGNRSRPYLSLVTGCWYEGTVVVNGKEKNCMIVDVDSNGVFNDLNPGGRSDRIAIFEDGTGSPIPLTKYVQVDGELYTPTVARDGSYIEIAPAQNVPYGYLEVSDNLSEIIISGTNGYFQPDLGKERKLKIPAGDYIVSRWYISDKDKTGREWRLGRYSSQKSVTVAEDETSELNISSDIYAFLEVSRKGNGYTFNRSMIGADGKSVDLRMGTGGYPPTPKLRFRDASGNYDKTFSLEYG
ncbi:hypothetical protein STSP2_01357 [Anaerohalosphaera lusitana]|uniref:Uncharacterized protein n=1 Tax=Anaerohalosphaera lusitana TaxID=1936003 RepID=A0A1U9NJV0_9BACT|nr:hypothetical protein [Anaerohalosphaera lusitana]AQT68202.1 hypothetical protein STSP2_01357 [Anaerohalosphaera lusitana]